MYFIPGSESDEAAGVSGADPAEWDLEGSGEGHPYDSLGPAERGKDYDTPVFRREAAGPTEHVYQNAVI